MFLIDSKDELKLRIEHFYSLSDAQEAHQDLEARKTTGKIILTNYRARQHNLR